MNFQDYHHFMTESLTNEIECRQKMLNLEPIKAIVNLRKILSLGEELQKKCEEISTEYKKIAYVPLNLEVQAARIGSHAATISVVSSQYGTISQQIQIETEKFLNSGNLGNSIKKNVRNCQLDVCNLILTKDLLDFFKSETKETPIDKNLEMRLLEELSIKGIEQVQDSLNKVEKVFDQFSSIFNEIAKLTTALDIVGITGKIEAVKIDEPEELLGLLNDLMIFKTSLKQSLKEIDNIGKDLILHTKEMKNELGTYLNK